MLLVESTLVDVEEGEHEGGGRQGDACFQRELAAFDPMQENKITAAQQQHYHHNTGS